jgi:hypothetical protein
MSTVKFSALLKSAGLGERNEDQGPQTEEVTGPAGLETSGFGLRLWSE